MLQLSFTKNPHYLRTPFQHPHFFCGNMQRCKERLSSISSFCSRVAKLRAGKQAGNFLSSKVRDEMMNFNLLIRSYRELPKWITILSLVTTLPAAARCILIEKDFLLCIGTRKYPLRTHNSLGPKMER